MPSVSDYSRLTLRKRLLMMENVVNLEMRSWCHPPMWLGTEKNMFHLISNQIQSKIKHFVVKRMDSDLYLGSLIIFLLRVSCCRFYPAYFCPAKRRDMVHLKRFEQAWGRFVRDRRCCSWMFMVESHMLSSKRAWSRSGPKSAQKCTVLVRDHTKKQAWKTCFFVQNVQGDRGGFS